MIYCQLSINLTVGWNRLQIFPFSHLPVKIVAKAHKNREITAGGISWDLAALVKVLDAASLFTHSTREDLYTSLVNPPILWRQTVARAEVANPTSTAHIGTHILQNCSFFSSKICAWTEISYLPIRFTTDSNNGRPSLSLACRKKSNLSKACFQQLFDERANKKTDVTERVTVFLK